MIGEIFYWIFNMSVTAVLCAVPVLLIRNIKRLPRRISLWLWLIVYIRLCLPVGISSKYSIMTLLSKLTTKTVVIFEAGDMPLFTATNHLMAANSYFPISYKINTLEKLFGVSGIIWLTVALCLVLIFTSVYIRTLFQIKDAKYVKEDLYVSKNVKLPAVYGIFRPKIVIPADFSSDKLEFVLMHERAHIKRGDNIWRIAALFITCIHWFDPFVWMIFRLLCTDLELACDEAVLVKCTEKERKSYAAAVLNAVERNSLISSAFGGSKIKQRLENILSYRKISVISTAAFSALLGIIAYILLTNAI